MATLAGQRAQFTWALNQYNLAEDQDTRTNFAKRMAKYIAAAPTLGFTVEQITKGQNYPAAEVNQYVNDPMILTEPGLSEEQAIQTVQEAVDTTNVHRIGEGSSFVYVYGYACLPDRLKVGSTESDSVQRIAAQVDTSTPDKPALLLEIKTDRCRALERAIQAVLELRGCKVVGGGTEWFRTNCDEVLSIYRFVNDTLDKSLP